MEHHNMKSPLLDVIGFTSLLLTLPWLNWLLANEPYMRAIGSYGAAVVVVWRVVVLTRRAYSRWANRRLEDKR
jgi:hypothetical protein